MLPWEAQWLLDYSTTVDWQEFDDEILFDLSPPDADSFYYDETLNICCSHLPLFSYEIAPILRI